MVDTTTQIVAACCRWPQDDSARTALAQALSGFDAWDQLWAALTRHRVFPLAQLALQPMPNVPEAFRDRLHAKARQIAIRSLKQTHETRRLCTMLRATGLHATTFKGVSLGQLAYGSPTLKACKDIDLFVPRSQAQEALEILQADGYKLIQTRAEMSPKLIQAILYNKKDVELVNDQNLIVELHWQLTNNPSLLQGLPDDPPVQNVACAGDETLPTLQDDALFAYLCVHGALHDWGRLKWLSDVAAYWQSFSTSEQAQRLAAAKTMGADIAVREALRLCHDLFDVPLHPEALPASAANVQRAMGIIQAPHAPDSPNAWVRRKALTGRRFNHARYDRRWYAPLTALAPSAISLGDVIAYPLPRRLNWMYWVIRLPAFALRLLPSSGHNKRS